MQTLQRAVRVVVLDEHGQVLLSQRTRSDGTACWETPGCALREGETFEDAARRCLAEGFGVQARPRRAWASSSASSMGGRLLFQEEQFFLARVPHFTPDERTLEKDTPLAVSFRWWTLGELEHPRGTLHLLPKDLPAHLRHWQEESLDFEASDLGVALGALDVVALR